jgi:hypothetical protein
MLEGELVRQIVRFVGKCEAGRKDAATGSPGH